MEFGARERRASVSSRGEGKTGADHVLVSARTLMFALVFAYLPACNGQRTGTTPDGGLPDTAQSTTCGFGVHVPEFDHQCKGGTGCRYISTPPTCGCGCAACDSEICVRTQCGMVCPDGGTDEDYFGGDAGDGGDLSDSGGLDGGTDDLAPSDTFVLGPEYVPITFYAEAAYAYGDYVSWRTSPVTRTETGLDVNDICYFKISAQKETCLEFYKNNFKLFRNFMNQNKISWSASDQVGESGIFCYDLDTSELIEVDWGGPGAIAGAIFGDSLVFSKYENPSIEASRRLYRYSFSVGAQTRLSTDRYPVYMSLFGNDLVYTAAVDLSSSYTTVRHYDLITDTERELNVPASFKVMPGFMWGRRFVWADWRGKYGRGPDVMMYDLDLDQEFEIDAKEYGQWFPSIYKNLIMWTDYSISKSAEGGIGHVWILDLDTNVRRQVTKSAADYTAQVFGDKYMLVSPYASSSVGPYYLYDLEANGVLKDGHVVPDEANSGGDR